ncbi:MAG: ribosomal protein S18-alanine N-acetyltransferase [Micrococcales bacterium]|nr:ribosomal protein S18-alanine N-acetyltransferase [Micrococcales bacterium]
MHWSDIETLAALDVELFADDAWAPATWWSELAERPRRRYVIEEQDGRIAAYGGVDVAGETADVMTIAVAPDAQGRGAGRAMLDALVRLATDGGAEALLLEVRADNESARKLYDRNGFETLTIRRRYYQPGDVDAVIMRRHLVREDQP